METPDEGDGDSEMALVTNNFQKYMKKIGNKQTNGKAPRLLIKRVFSAGNVKATSTSSQNVPTLSRRTRKV